MNALEGWGIKIVNRKIITVEECVKRQQDAEKKTLSYVKRRQMILEGLVLYAKRVKREGADNAPAIAKLADEAALVMAEFLEYVKKSEQPLKDVLGAAISKAASELSKKLPACFSSEGEAMKFAESLPHSEARLAQTAIVNEREKTNYRKAKLGRALDVIFEKTAVAMGELDTSKGTQRLIEFAKT